MTDFGRRAAIGDMLKAVYDPNDDGVIAFAQTQADMIKAVYDPLVAALQALAAAHKTQHQTGGTDEINCTGLVGRVNLVDRGDPLDWDWDTSDFTDDGAFHDLDCSAIVPAGASFVWLRVHFAAAQVDKTFVFIEKGRPSSYNAFAVTTQVNGMHVSGDGLVPCDANRFLEYYLPNSIGPDIGVVVRGWVI